MVSSLFEYDLPQPPLCVCLITILCFRASLNIPFPTKTHRERRESFKHTPVREKGSTSGSLPRFVPADDNMHIVSKLGMVLRGFIFKIRQLQFSTVWVSLFFILCFFLLSLYLFPIYLVLVLSCYIRQLLILQYFATIP